MRRALLISIGLLFTAACNPQPVAEATVIPARTVGITVEAPEPTTTSQPLAAEAVDIPQAEIVYYDISGATGVELRIQLSSLGPVGYDGYRGDATTQWYIRWNWPGYGSSECNLSQATVSSEVKVIFPRWKPPEKVAPDLVARWNVYVRALAEHEKGHVDYVVDRLPAIREAIQKATCETADDAATEILNQIRQHDLDYDAETKHGATQGARFP